MRKPKVFFQSGGKAGDPGGAGGAPERTEISEIHGFSVRSPPKNEKNVNFVEITPKTGKHKIDEKMEIAPVFMSAP